MFDFPDTIETSKIPAAWKFAYVEADEGQSTFNPDFQEVRSTIGGLRGSLDKARTDADKAKSRGNETISALNTLLETVGVDDVAALSTHISELNTAVEKGSKINPEKIKAEIEGGYQKTIDELNEKLTAQGSVMKETILGRDVSEAIAAHKGNAALLGPYVRGRLTMIEDEGKMHIRVLDGDGDHVGDGKGGWQNVSQFVETLKADPQFAGAFEAAGGAGGPGMQPQHQQNQQHQQQNQQNQQNQQKTPAQKISDGLRARQMGNQQRVAGAGTPPGMT